MPENETPFKAVTFKLTAEQIRARYRELAEGHRANAAIETGQEAEFRERYKAEQCKQANQTPRFAVQVGGKHYTVGTSHGVDTMKKWAEWDLNRAERLEALARVVAEGEYLLTLEQLDQFKLVPEDPHL